MRACTSWPCLLQRSSIQIQIQIQSMHKLAKLKLNHLPIYPSIYTGANFFNVWIQSLHKLVLLPSKVIHSDSDSELAQVGKVKVKGHPFHKLAKLSASRVIHPSIHSSIHPEANFQMCEWSIHKCPFSKEFLYLNRNHKKRMTGRK